MSGKIINSKIIDGSTFLSTGETVKLEDVIELRYKGNMKLLRKFLLEEQEAPAIEYVVFHEHSSEILPESLSHRMGLLVIDPSIIDDQYEAVKTDKGSLRMVKANLFFENTTENVQIVMSGDIKLKDGSTSPCYHNNEELFRIMPGKKIDCDLYIVKGFGSSHAKFHSVKMVFYYEDENAEASDDTVYIVKIECFGNVRTQEILDTLLYRFK